MKNGRKESTKDGERKIIKKKNCSKIYTLIDSVRLDGRRKKKKKTVEKGRQNDLDRKQQKR